MRARLIRDVNVTIYTADVPGGRKVFFPKGSEGTVIGESRYHDGDKYISEHMIRLDCFKDVQDQVVFAGSKTAEMIDKHFNDKSIKINKFKGQMR